MSLIPYTLKRALKNKLRLVPVSHSQMGQDLWVYSEVFDRKRGGYYVDVGAHDGVEFSNTLILD